MKIVFFSSNFKETHLYVEDYLVKNFKNVLIIKEHKITFIKLIIFWIKFLIRIFKYFSNKILGNNFFFPIIPLFKKSKYSFYLNKKNKQKLFQDVVNFNPDIILLYTNIIIPTEIYSKFLSINLHTGITPFYKGKDTTEWALVDNNFYFTGYTIMKIGNEIDLGKIIKIQQIYPLLNEKYSDFKYRLHFIASRELVQTVGREINFYENCNTINFKKYKLFNKKKELLNLLRSENYINFLNVINSKKYNYTSTNHNNVIKKGFYIVYLDLDTELLNSFFDLNLNFIKNKFQIYDFKIFNNVNDLTFSIKNPIIFITKYNQNLISNQNFNYINKKLVFLKELTNNSNILYNLKYNIYFIVKKDNQFDFLNIINVLNLSKNYSTIILDLMGINDKEKKNFFHSIKVNRINYKNFQKNLSLLPIINKK